MKSSAIDDQEDPPFGSQIELFSKMKQRDLKSLGTDGRESQPKHLSVFGANEGEKIKPLISTITSDYRLMATF